MNSIVCPKILLTALGLICLAISPSVQAQWPTDFHNVGDSFIEFGAKIYDRPGDDTNFTILQDSVTNQVILGSGELTDLNGGAGAEVYFGSIGPRCRRWEARAFLTSWGRTFNFDQANLSSPLSPMIDPDEVNIGYDSEIYSIEFNLRKPFTPGFTFITGPRFIALNEELSITSETTIPTPPLGTFDLMTENTIVTTNRLLGLQVGGLVNLPVSRNIYVNGFVRAGGYGNFTRLRTSAETTVMPEVRTVVRRDVASFVGEVGGKLYWDLVPGVFGGFLGYEATWIDGVALAPVQAATLNPTFITTEVTPFFQAVIFGLQFRR